MRQTKNIVLGIIGLFITIYVVLIGLNLYSIQTHKNQLENSFSRLMQQSLEEGFASKNEEKTIQELEQQLAESLSGEGELSMEIKEIDLEKGILSAVVSEVFSLADGSSRTISLEKTVIMERCIVNEPKVLVTFLVEGESYKEYQMVKGETCPMPKSPSENFIGWREEGAENTDIVSLIGPVWNNQTYIAVME